MIEPTGKLGLGRRPGEWRGSRVGCFRPLADITLAVSCGIIRHEAFEARTISLMVFSSSAIEAQVPHLYAVVFGVGLGSDGKVEKLTVSQVIDPSSGTTDPVAIVVPQTFLEAAKRHLRVRTYSTEKPHFFTYLFYDEAQPTNADIDPKRAPNGN